MFEKALEILRFFFPPAGVSFPGAYFSQLAIAAKTSGKGKTVYQKENIGM